MQNKEPLKVSQQVNLLMRQFKPESKLMQILLWKPRPTIKFQLMLIIRHGKSISRILNSFLTMLNITRKSTNVKESVQLIRKPQLKFNSITKDFKTNSRHLKPNQQKILRSSYLCNNNTKVKKLKIKKICKLINKHRRLLQYQIQEFLMLKELIIIQAPHQWIQIKAYGKEKLSMMEKFMEKRIIKKMPTTFKSMVKNKKLLPILDFHMHQLLKFLHQLVQLRTKMDSHMLMLRGITIQELHQWIQMLKFGREKKFMMVKSMVKKITCKMQLISKLMEKNKKLLLIQDFHMHQPLKKEASHPLNQVQQL